MKNTNVGFITKTEHLNPWIKSENPNRKREQDFTKFLRDLYHPNLNKSRFLI